MSCGGLLFVGLVAVFGASLASADPRLASSKEKPNFVFFLSDDHGWWNMGHINPEIHMPVTRKLAQNGMNLTRHYVFRFCSPTRSALMTGRLPFHVNQENSAEWPWNAAPVDVRMTMLPAKLATAGYTSAHFGKWHLGLASDRFTPIGRGFNRSLGYLAGSEHHFSQSRGCQGCPKGHTTGIDLISNDKPAFGLNGTWGTQLYTEAALDFIDKVQGPFFMYMAYQNTHEPLEVPQQFTNLYPEDWLLERRIYNGMASAVDSSVGNITDKLRAKGLWDNTLIVFSSDNGGPALVGGPSFANNFPLRGSKGDDFEGGVRAGAFVTGGLVPAHRRGTQVEHSIHIADWWVTFCRLAGVADCTDNAEGVPGLDSVDVWPLLSGTNTSAPRVETVVHLLQVNGKISTAALINGGRQRALTPCGEMIRRRGGQQCVQRHSSCVPLTFCSGFLGVQETTSMSLERRAARVGTGAPSTPTRPKKYQPPRPDAPTAAFTTWWRTLVSTTT
eukprot:m.232547 g.232547  ORF g.232547 m.232547 type:complete len:501 (+) comp18884_c0_seq1:111-1613(+)